LKAKLADQIFFIYVAKNSEWQQRQREDWAYVSAMSSFFYWWIRQELDVNVDVKADILPVIPGKLFDRMSIDYLVRDHNERDKSTYHFYLAYFKPFWTDCPIEGFSTDNFGMMHWKRPQDVTESDRVRFFADENCAKVSHLLCHEILRMKGKKKKDYFTAVHDLWDEHMYKDLPFIYYNDRYRRVSQGGNYRFVTIDASKLV
jgi:hypothetical protein